MGTDGQHAGGILAGGLVDENVPVACSCIVVGDVMAYPGSAV